MCGRFTLFVDPQDLMDAFPGFEAPEHIAPRYNIAPTQPVAVIANTGQNKIEFFRWGLIPSWATPALAGGAREDPAIGDRMINARAETLAEKPSFRTAYRRRRCLVLADGFYEWRKEPGQRKTPMFIRLQSGRPFAFAGLWESWRPPDDQPILSCTIITTTPNELLAPIHNRMPVILAPEAYDLWLDPAEKRPDQLRDWLRPFPADQMTAHPVSTLVNNPQNDAPACIVPARQ